MHRRLLSLLCKLFALVAVCHLAEGQQLTISGDILIEKKGSFLQTSAADVSVYKPSISLTFEFSPSAAFDTLMIEPRGSGVTWSLPRTSPESTASFSKTREFDNQSAAAAALPIGFYSVSVDSTHLPGGLRSRTDFNFNVTVDFPASSPRFADFTALQSWDGSALTLSWSGLPSSESLAELTLEILRSDGRVAYSSSSTDGKNPLSTTAVASTPIAITSSPGETLTAVLTYTRPLGLPLITGGNIVANNQLGELRMPIRRALTTPSITAHPSSVTAPLGSSQTFTVSATGESLSYSWKKNGAAIPGATTSTFTLTSVSVTDAGAYTVTVTNSGGSVTSNAATLTIVAAAVAAPTIALAPTGVTVSAGAGFALSVTAAGTGPFSYQWFQNGTPLRGAIFPTLSFLNSPPAAAGAYSVRITNLAGSVTSVPVVVTVTPISRISNLSVLTSLTDSTDNFTLGYVIGGANTTGPKPLVIRAVGPALAALGVAGTLDDPKLELFAGSTKTNENDNWGTFLTGATALTAAFSAVGAFPFPSPTSRDAAVTTSLTTRDNSVKISAANESTGLVIAEVYDATPSGSFTTATPRLLNVSVLKSLGTGLTVGFTIAGSAPKTVLIRAIGPTLGDFGVPDTVADPQLVLFNSASAKITENDNWGGTKPLSDAFTSVGAFALPSISRDAALLTTLQPGGYSVQVSGVNNTTGTALVEVYEVP